MRALILLLALVMATNSACVRTRSREADDRADALRRCDRSIAIHEASVDRSIKCAEWFVASQGYTDAAPHADTARIVPEGIEYGGGRREWIAQRAGSLSGAAVGVCETPASTQVLVVFASTRSDELRVVTLFRDGRALRVQHSGLARAVLDSGEHGCRRLGSSRADGAT